MNYPDHTFCIAPMMDRSDRHFRYFLRLISRHVLLYTEMITTSALIHGDWRKLLDYDVSEHPIALQLGGNDPQELAYGAGLAEQLGYDEVNINVGCPSNRVSSGSFGACLMAQPQLVAQCVNVMRRRVDLPITVKTRIGVDEQDSYEWLTRFVSTVANGGCRTFIIHARKAWLQGLSPKQNRELPPLRYDVVYRLKQDFPELEIVLNGGLSSVPQAQMQLNHVDGVMLGREVYRNPYLLATVDELFFADNTVPPSRHGVIKSYLPYIDAQLAQGVPLSRIMPHIMGLFQGLPGARGWRRELSNNPPARSLGKEIVERALLQINDQG
ncbi:MAG: tRNA dihydrouridine(20/20a) synthase DusA [Gammaproteobacteria bacterium]|nr:tRNA dihydrouridine(20/20a) synthase DusA [Gammaproteobacteria bacterium]